MKRIRSVIHIILSSLIAALGLSSCEYAVKYGGPVEKYGCQVDTTVHCMYGVDPSPITWDENSQNEDAQQ